MYSLTNYTSSQALHGLHNTGDRLVESKRSRSIPSVKELVQRMSGFQIEDIHPGKIETVPKSFGESKLQEREKGTSIYLYSKCKLEGERPKTYRSCLCVFEWVGEKQDVSHFDISVVSVGSLNRLFVLPIFASRWNGYE